MLSKNAITKYQLIFRHLFHCKHVERQLSSSWLTQQATPNPNPNPHPHPNRNPNPNPNHNHNQNAKPELTKRCTKCEVPESACVEHMMRAAQAALEEATAKQAHAPSERDEL